MRASANRVGFPLIGAIAPPPPAAGGNLKKFRICWRPDAKVVSRFGLNEKYVISLRSSHCTCIKHYVSYTFNNYCDYYY